MAEVTALTKDGWSIATDRLQALHAQQEVEKSLLQSALNSDLRKVRTGYTPC